VTFTIQKPLPIKVYRTVTVSHSVNSTPRVSEVPRMRSESKYQVMGPINGGNKRRASVLLARL